jgi:hypothetical protein
VAWQDNGVHTSETLGVQGHAGGLVVDRPELTVGVLKLVSRPIGVELDLLARRPLDSRTATQRQSDIRSKVAGPPTAPRHLLPEYDEGMDLRVAWLDRTGRPHWEYGSFSVSTGTQVEGPSLRTTIRLPPMYDELSIVLAWPEIGFPETVVTVPLPDRATVEAQDVSLWTAPVADARPVPSLRHRVQSPFPTAPAVEAGRLVARPQVLLRGPDAVVALTRLTAIGPVLSLELLCLARNEAAATVSTRQRYVRGPDPTRSDDPDVVRQISDGASAAVIDDGNAWWAWIDTGQSGRGLDNFLANQEYLFARPAGEAVDLVVGWPAAGLADVLVTVAYLGAGQ